MNPPRRTLLFGSIRWHLSTSVVCAGPSERLIVTRGLDASDREARAAIRAAARMEWRDARGRRWTVERDTGSVSFFSHYHRLGPVPLPARRSLAELSDPELEDLLERARLLQG